MPVFLILVLIFMPSQTLAADPDISHFNVDNLFLPSNYVNSQAIDDSGDIWLGLEAAFDFNNLVKINIESYWDRYGADTGVGALENNAAWDIDIDSDGHIWIATLLGVLEFDTLSTWTWYKDSLVSINTYTVEIDNSGDYWFGSFSAGVTRFDGGTGWTIYQAPATLEDNRIRDILAASDNTIWIATLGGLTHFDGISTWITYTADNSDLHDNNTYSVIEDNDGNIWVGTESGICQFDGISSWTCYESATSDIAPGRVIALAIDSSGNVWCGHKATDADHVMLSNFDGSSTWTAYDINSGANTYIDVTAIVVDFSGDIWAATAGEGVARLRFNSSAAPDNDNPIVPNNFILHQNYPNPFNPATTIEFSLPSKSDISISIYNMLGQQIKTLIDKTVRAGKHAVQWDGTDRRGNDCSSGIYFYRIKTEDYSQTHRMVLLR